MLRVTVLPLTPEVAEEAARLIDRHLLRSLDAVQLATAVIFRKSLPEFSELKFISSDEELLLAATAEGLSVWQPHL